MLKEVIGASMRAFWDFLHADKEEVCAIPLMGIHGVQVVLQDPSDTELLAEIRSSLQKVNHLSLTCDVLVLTEL